MLECADDAGHLADADGQWEPSDYIVDNALPRARMVWARHADHFYVIECEHGGYGTYSEAIAIEIPMGRSPAIVRAKKQCSQNDSFLAVFWLLGLSASDKQ